LTFLTPPRLYFGDLGDGSKQKGIFKIAWNYCENIMRNCSSGSFPCRKRRPMNSLKGQQCDNVYNACYECDPCEFNEYDLVGICNDDDDIEWERIDG
jgi:hypothetical protein